MHNNRVLVVGATVLYDYIFAVDQLPQPGKPAFIKNRSKGELDRKYHGGTAFNIAVQLAMLGDRSKILHPVGSGFPGSGYEKKLNELDVGMGGLLLNKESPSGIAFLFTDSHDETLIFTYPSELREGAIPASVYEEVGWFVLTPTFGPLQENALGHFQSGRHSLAVVGMAHPALVEHLEQIDLLSINAAEAEQLEGYAGFHSSRQLAEALGGDLIITEDKRGCRIYEKGRDVTQLYPISPPKFIDPTGAGDAFAAAVIAGLRRGYSTVEAARIGTAAASFVVEAVGCQTNMPTWDEIITRLNEHALGKGDYG